MAGMETACDTPAYVRRPAQAGGKHEQAEAPDACGEGAAARADILGVEVDIVRLEARMDTRNAKLDANMRAMQ